MKIYKRILIFCLLLITIGCHRNNEASNEIINENELLKEKITTLEENLALKEAELSKITEDINELLKADQVGGLNPENTYYDRLKDNIVNGYIDYEKLNTVIIDECLSGVYHAEYNDCIYVFVAFPTLEYVMITQSKSSGVIKASDGTYSLKDGEMFLNEDIASGGGDVWKYNQVITNGFTVKIIPPMSTSEEGIIVEFVKM